ncbi:reverse transcriptase [Abeliophyllum distichum]|uniref:Reverse transcriptase n=1 Tax=Abeliophyllum distichum TaxID=126358 RepID=A0ABD1S8Z4_9LAMI
MCGNHQGANMLAFRAIRQGYYWPTMKTDVKELVQKCDACQRHANLIHLPAECQTAVFGICPILSVGDRPLGTISNGQSAKKIFGSCDRLFQKMGGGGTTCNDNN